MNALEKDNVVRVDVNGGLGSRSLENLSTVVGCGVRDEYIQVEDHEFPEILSDKMKAATVRVFQLPQEVKTNMSKRPDSSFLGFTGRGDEITNGHVDSRELFDFATEVSLHNDMTSDAASSSLIGNNVWPDPSSIGTDFRPVVESYMAQMRSLYHKLLVQLELTLQLPGGSLQQLDHEGVQHRLKLIKYYPTDNASTLNAQGVGAHQDETGWLTFVAEVDNPGLEVHTRSGTTWQLATLGDGLWGLNVGKAFERATSGAIHATLHRVLSPLPSDGPRHSIAFFAGLPLDQTYQSLVAIFNQSPVIRELQGSPSFGSSAYSNEISKLLCGQGEGTTFGATQLDMWKRSYRLHDQLGKVDA
ncbi:hypothetical protein GGR54DRAFT_626755 [Hypoxylon sp. NC1633]|nr:hypothetical protein GGR54DRAFT_626755 [Hypoxylon sp. NC1633]